MTFVHLHTHSDFSALDGMGRIPSYVTKAKRMGQPALALTDHGNIAGLPLFYRECRDQGITPVLGQEFYFLPKLVKEKKYPDYQHLTVLARGERGYRVLSELSTEGFQNFYYKPAIDRETLLSLGKELKYLTILSGCLQGPLSKAAKVGMDALDDEVMWWQKFIPHLYIEIQHHDIPEDRIVNARLLKAARRHMIPVVITEDSHYCDADDADFHDALLAIQTGSGMGDTERFRFDGEGYWLKSAKEMRRTFKEYPASVFRQGAESTLEIAEDCRASIPEWEARTWHIPEVPGVDDPFSVLALKAKRALVQRGLARIRHGRARRPYIERLQHELRVIKRMDVAGFLLIAADIMEWAEKRGILTGSGRGSVGGSLVAFLLGITRIDPVKYNLRFDRFLNPERPRMPDIDIDFQADRRDEAYEYVRQTYGEDNVIGVATFVRMGAKRAFKALAKSHGISFDEANEITKDFPDDEEDAPDHIPERILQKYPELADQLEALTGIRCGFGTHPAGIVIAPSSFKLHEKIPRMWIASSKRWVAQYDLEVFEGMGLLKHDLLGLRTLETVAECLRLVEEFTGERPDIESWEPDEMPWEGQMWDMICKGRTAGIFQLEGPSSTQGCMEMQPRCFADLVNLLALYRKGPMLAGMTDTFLKNRERGEADYIHPSLESVLEETHGAMVFQEQLIEIGERVVGLSLGDNDDLLRATAKKKADLMATIEPKLIEGCISNGWTKEQAEELWKQIKEQSEYTFNLSHSTGYAKLSYETASLKTLHPLEFYCALLRTVPGKDKQSKAKRIAYLKEAYTSGTKILFPDVNHSDVHAIPVREKEAIRFGLTDITGVGEKVARRIIEHRDDGYWSSSQVEDVVNNSRTYRILKDAAALRSLGEKPNIEKAEELLEWSNRDRMEPWRAKLDGQYNPPDIVYGEITNITKAKTRGGKPYVTWTVRWDHSQEWKVRIWSEAKEHHKVPKGSVVRVTGHYQERWRSISVGHPEEIAVLEM